MSTPRNDAVMQFFSSMVPSTLMEAYGTMASLKYPIQDRHSLMQQLDGLTSVKDESDKCDKCTLEFIRTQFGPFDFPIDTAQNGLEKLHGRIIARQINANLSTRNFPRPDDDPLPSNFPGEIERKSPAETYMNEFGRNCARVALSAYQAAQGDGSEWAAITAGLAEGQKCRDYGYGRFEHCVTDAMAAYHKARDRHLGEAESIREGDREGVSCERLFRLTSPFPPGTLEPDRRWP